MIILICHPDRSGGIFIRFLDSARNDNFLLTQGSESGKNDWMKGRLIVKKRRLNRLDWIVVVAIVLLAGYFLLGPVNNTPAPDFMCKALKVAVYVIVLATVITFVQALKVLRAVLNRRD